MKSSLLIVLIIFSLNSFSQNPNEKLPEFIGGEVNLQKSIKDSITYPYKSFKKGIEGKVYLKFLIDTLGKPTDITVNKSINKELDEEAIRVINSLPAWIPGEQGGKKVSVWMSFPVNFIITEDTKVAVKKKK